MPPAQNNVSVPNVANTTTPNFGSPAYTKMAPQVFQPQANRKQQFQSLFPNDALSAAIAERGQQ